MVQTSPPDPSAPRVAVIGAGIAGLRCAEALLTNGATVKVFEARQRIGGRVHQIDVGGHKVDLGANWIHYTDANPIVDIAKATDSELFWRPADSAIIGSDGVTRSPELTKRLNAARNDIIERAYVYSAAHKDEIDPDTSLLEFVREKAVEAYSTEPEFLSDLLGESERWGLFIGEPISKQSLKFLGIEEGPSGDDAFVASTYEHILAYIAQIPVKEGVIHLGQEVTRISYGLDDDERPVLIETSDGTRESFDEVVITCPLGWLKQEKEKVFEPPLPKDLSEGINNVGYGKLEKLYISFPSAFWLQSQNQSSAEQPQPFPAIIHFQDPKHGFYPPGLPANTVSISLAHLPSNCSHPTLMFYIHGPCGTRMTQSIAKLVPNSTEYNQTIDQFARPYYSRLPNYNPEDPACSPTALFASAWQNDPFAGNGSYSNGQVGRSQLDLDLRILHESNGVESDDGLGVRTSLWFAGEHTAPMEYLATTTGAYLSGKRVADYVLRKWAAKASQSK